MSTINSNDLRVKNAKNLATELQTTSYIFISKPTEWATGDESPPTPSNNTREFNNTYDEMLSLSLITADDIHYMIPRVTWTSGIVYDMYRHDYTPTNVSASGAKNLYNAVFYVINQNYDVYVCLSNDGNTASSVEPQNTSGTPFFTSDGYQWLRVFRLSPDEIFNYTTANYIPVSSNDLVNGDNGAINTVVIDTPGAEYTVNPAGVTNQIPYYYCRIVGDGSGAVARVTVSAGSIVDIEVVRSGSGYTYATLDFVSGRTYSSLTSLDNNSNGLNPLGDDTFNSTVIISPTGGWGTDIVREMGGTRVGVFTTLEFNETDFFPDVTFRRIGLLKDPTFRIANPNTATGCFAINVTDYGGPSSYTVGERLSQVVTVGGVSKNAFGTVVGYDDTNNIVRYIQDPTIHSDGDGTMYPFSGTDYLVGITSGKTTKPTTFTGTLAETSFFSGYSSPEVNKYSGLMIYMSNISPVLRQSTQSEKVSLIVSY